MLDTTNVLLFLLTALVLIFTPGPDMIYVAARGISQGRKVAALSTAGVCLGYVVHTALAALGLSALLASSATAFRVVQYVGAAYLLYLGIRTLRDRSAFDPTGEVPPLPTGAVLRQGMLTSILNPKGILFFLSFLPQFVVPEAGGIAFQVVALGLTFTTLCLLLYGAVALSSGVLGDRFRRTPRFADALRWVSGSVLVALGIRLVLPERR